MATKKHSYFFISILILVIILCSLDLIFSNKEINSETKPSVSILSKELMNQYIKDEKKADSLYTDKVIEVTGTLKNISFLNKKITIILNSYVEDTNFICELNDSEKNKIVNLDKDNTITIKGICKGFLKDIVLLNCYIDTIKNNE